jgi:hypothetical protein
MDVNEQQRMSNITQIKVQNQFFIAVLHFTVTLASSTYPKMSVIRPHIMQLNVTLYLSIKDTSGLCCRSGVSDLVYTMIKQNTGTVILQISSSLCLTSYCEVSNTDQKRNWSPVR